MPITPKRGSFLHADSQSEFPSEVGEACLGHFATGVEASIRGQSLLICAAGCWRNGPASLDVRTYLARRKNRENVIPIPLKRSA
jgi:hypothetical protein